MYRRCCRRRVCRQRGTNWLHSAAAYLLGSPFIFIIIIRFTSVFVFSHSLSLSLSPSVQFSHIQILAFPRTPTELKPCRYYIYVFTLPGCVSHDRNVGLVSLRGRASSSITKISIALAVLVFEKHFLLYFQSVIVSRYFLLSMGLAITAVSNT